MDLDVLVIAGETLIVLINDCCRNPSSLFFRDKSFKVTTLTSEGRLIEEKTSNVVFKSLTPRAITTFDVEHGSTVLGAEQTTFGVFFSITSTIPAPGKVEIIFPPRLDAQTSPNEGFVRPDYTVTEFTMNGLTQVVQNISMTTMVDN